jgi:hypothetical protein
LPLAASTVQISANALENATIERRGAQRGWYGAGTRGGDAARTFECTSSRRPLPSAATVYRLGPERFCGQPLHEKTNVPEIAARRLTRPGALAAVAAPVETQMRTTTTNRRIGIPATQTRLY